MSNSGEVWQDDGDEKPKPPRRKSSNMRVIIIILSVCGLCCVLCCGAMGIAIWSVFPVTSPEGVRKATQDIVAIEVPQQFKPVAAMNLFGQLRFAIYQVGNSPDEGMLMIAAYSKQMQGPGQNPKQQMKDAMRQQGHQQVELDIEKSETKEFKIRGEDCKFQFAEAKNPETDEEFRQVTGTFPCSFGEGMLLLQLPAEDFDQAEIEKMIESMH